jgi:homogentisate 1,2-dioxygenase
LRNIVLGKKPEELLNLQGKEITTAMRKLNAFTEKVRQDMEKKLISEADGQELIVKATIVVSMLTIT